MRALTLLEPWATLVALGLKRVETRSWCVKHPHVGGNAIAIHASKSRAAIDDGTAAKLFGLVGKPVPEVWPLGQIIAVARIVKVEFAYQARATISSIEESFGNYSMGRFAWHLADVRRLKFRVPCRGMLGLWTVPPDINFELEEAR